MYSPVHKLNRYIHLLQIESLLQSVSVLVLVSGRCRRRLIAIAGVEATPAPPEELSVDEVVDVIVDIAVVCQYQFRYLFRIMKDVYCSENTCTIPRISKRATNYLFSIKFFVFKCFIYSPNTELVTRKALYF